MFVANAKHDLWDEDVLTGVDDNANFNEARLNLPSKPFDESNMYFMDVVEINENRNQADKSSLNKQILLERVINKIEVKLDEEIASAEDLDAYVTQKLGDFYDANYVKEDNQGVLDKVVWAYMNGIKSFITENLNVLPVPEKAQKKFRDDYIDPDKTRDGQKNDNKTLVIKSINACDDPTCIDDISKRCVKHWLINELKEAFIQRCNWSDIQSVEVIYAKENYPTSIDFYRHYRAEEQTDENVVTKIPSKNGDYCYVWYAFGSNGDESSRLGMVSSVAFKGVDSNFSVSCEKVPGIDLSGGNWNLELVYNPIAAMSVGVADSENPYTREQYNIQNVLSWTWNDFDYRDVVWEKSDMIKWVNSLFSESESESEFTSYTLSLPIPLISIVDVDSWKTGKAGN